ncbi:hypothetical protein HPB50_010345 [Hyalomma asiaticum]|uniref:Uncharacterized protein n=1 Tax=Hyalomma asiaticum TaxID=266040 RepID=A0ACB7TKG7_HYAAI|nr:hypothetical protein HPB50_010345 [Hyalomma asiaticum]
MKGTGSATSCEDFSKRYETGRHCAAAARGPLWSVWGRSSSSNFDETAKDTEEEDEEWDGCQVKDGSPLLSSHPRPSLARQGVKTVRDAEVQTLEWVPELRAELEYMLAQRKAEIAKLEEMLNSMQLSSTRETQDVRAEFFRPLKMPAPPPTFSVASEKTVRRVVNEQTLTAAGEACTEDSPLSPQASLVCGRCRSFHPKQEDKQAVVASLSPLFTGDKVPRGSLERLPMPEFPNFAV